MTPLKTRVLLADDHALVRRGLRLVLDAEPDLEVVAETGDGAEAIQRALEPEVDLAILDISMPEKDGLEVIRDLKAAGVMPKILVLSMHHSKELIAAVRDLGASGYILKTNAAQDLIRAMEDVFDGGTFFPDGNAKTPSNAARNTQASDSGRKNPMFRMQLGFAGV